MKLHIVKHIFVIIVFCLLSTISYASDLSQQNRESSGKAYPKRIVFGCDANFPPFTFLDENGTPSGYYVDLVKCLGDALNYDVEIKLTQWDRIVTGILKDKTINLTALAYQKRREKDFLFSVPQLIETSEIFIRKDTKGIEAFDDLLGKEIIMQRNATTHMNLEDQQFKAEYILVDSMPEALLRLSEGRHDAAIGARYMGLSVVQRYRLTNLITVGEPLFPRDYVLATALDNQNLLNEINRGLVILKADGRYNDLNKKWFGTAQEQKHVFSRVLYYGLVILIPILIFACLSAIWNRSLKKQVKSRTAELLAELNERERTEKALVESEAKFKRLSHEFKAILDGIPGILALFDKNLQIVWSNHADRKGAENKNASLFESKENSVLSALLLHNNEYPFHKCYENGREIEYLNADENGRTWEVRGYPMKDSQGKSNHVLVLATDITENIQLREEAITASRLASLGELSAGIAHEINNPTGLILFYVPLLKDFFSDITRQLESDGRIAGDTKIGGLQYDRVRTEIDKSLNGVVECANRIKRTVEDLKKFARQDDNDMSESVDINNSVQTAIRLTGGLIKKTTDTFTTHYDKSAPCIKGNLQRIEQVVINLIQNACFAIENKKGGIFIRTKLDQKAQEIIIEIEDQGCGMRPGILKRITDPFFTTRREAGGTGIGLSISARIVEEHGGKLLFESQPGRGTRACVIFSVKGF